MRQHAHFPLRPTACLVLALSACLPVFAQGQNVQDAVRQGDLLLRQEQERLRLEQERSRLMQPPSGLDLSTVLPRPDASSASGPCKNIKSITLKGANLMDQDDQVDVTQEFVARCLAAPDIEQLMARVTEHYIERGFITTRAYLPAQDLSKGELELVVVEGRIERLLVEGDPAGRVNLATTVPAQAGDVLNMRDLEQAVDQINAISANKVKLDILPGSIPGQSVVRFTNQASKPWSLQVSADNQGSASTGRNGVSTTLSLGGVLGFNEGLSFTHRTSTPHTAKAASDSTAVALVLPSGYTTYALSGSVSNYSTGITTPQGLGFVVNGRSTTLSLGAERILARDQNSRHAATATLSSVDSKNYIDGELLQVSSRRASTLGVGSKSMVAVGGGLVLFKPELVLGLNDMGNLPAGVNAASDGPQAQFSKLMTSLSYDKRFTAQSQDWGWSSSFTGQYSPDSLLSSQQILIGGLSSVRGFMSQSLSGDTGYYWRNEMSWFKPFQLGGISSTAKAYVGYDIGSVRNQSAAATNGSMTGWVLGVNAQLAAATVDLSWTRAGKLPSGMTREAGQTWLRVSFSL